MKKILLAGLIIFIVHNIGHAQSQLPPVKQGVDAAQVRVKAELPFKGGASARTPAQTTSQSLTQSAAQGLTQYTSQGLSKGSSQKMGQTENVAPLKTANAAGAAKPAAQSATGSPSAQKAPVKGGGDPSGSSPAASAKPTTGTPASGKSATTFDANKPPIKASKPL